MPNPIPAPVASGYRWMPRFDFCDHWELRFERDHVGTIASWLCDADSQWVAWKRGECKIKQEIYRGQSIADCARALVAAVKGKP